MKYNLAGQELCVTMTVSINNAGIRGNWLLGEIKLTLSFVEHNKDKNNKYLLYFFIPVSYLIQINIGTFEMNEVAENALNKYLDQQQPSVPHAILLHGAWGSGKTHFLKKIYEPARLKKYRSENIYTPPFLYISLHGVSTTREVQSLMYKAADPVGHFLGRAVKTIVTGIGEICRAKETTKILVDGARNVTIKRIGDFIFVFDDLERVNINALPEIIGLINSFLTEGRRVILLADEDKLIDNEFWKEQNEKTIGRRVEIFPDFESVIKYSIGKIKDKRTSEFIENHSEYIMEIVALSKVKNLRNLSWAIHNSSFFVSCLLSDGDITEDHVKLTLGLVIATTLWLRAGLLDSKSIDLITGIQRTVLAKSTNNNPAELDAHQQKAKDFTDIFRKFSVDRPAIDYRFIKTFENSGTIDNIVLVEWVKSQFGFGNNNSEPAWREVWRGYERPRKQTNVAIENLAIELTNKKYKQFGEILHCAGLAIRQERYGDKRLTAGEEVVSFFEKYIQEISKTTKLIKLDSFNNPFFGDSSYGLGFIEKESDKFKNIIEIYSKIQTEQNATLIKNEVENLLSQAENGKIEALLDLVYNDNIEITQTPILKDIDPSRMANLLARDMPELEIGTRLFAFRYNKAAHADPLLEEIPWAKKVYKQIIENINKWDEFDMKRAKDHINTGISYYEKNRMAEDRILDHE